MFNYRYMMVNLETGEEYPTGGVFLDVVPFERLVNDPNSPVVTLTLTTRSSKGMQDLFWTEFQVAPLLHNTNSKSVEEEAIASCHDSSSTGSSLDGPHLDKGGGYLTHSPKSYHNCHQEEVSSQVAEK